MKTKIFILLAFLASLVACNPRQPETVFIITDTQPAETQTSSPVPAIVFPTETPLPTQTQTPTATMVPAVADNGLILDERTIVVLEAAKKAVLAIQGPYSWEEFRHCSSFVSEYMRALGYPVNGPFNRGEDYDNAFPWSNVATQVDWLRQKYPDRVFDAPLSDFLNGYLWEVIPPGSLVYLQTAINHNGYNTYYHVAVLVGYHTDGSPQFAEFAPEMETGASVDRTFWELIGFYSILPEGGWDIRPYYGTQPLLVTWFNPLP